MKPKNKVTMSKNEFAKEHVRLVKILKSGTNKQQYKEGTEQAKELKGLKGYLAKKR